MRPSGRRKRRGRERFARWERELASRAEAGLGAEKTFHMRNSLGWLETRLAQNTSNYLKMPSRARGPGREEPRRRPITGAAGRRRGLRLQQLQQQQQQQQRRPQLDRRIMISARSAG